MRRFLDQPRGGERDLADRSFALAVGVVLVAVFAVSAGLVGWVTVYVVLAGWWLAKFAGPRIAVDEDRSWLPRLLPVMFLIKMVGGLVNYAMTTTLWNGGDAANVYHRFAIEIAPELRQLQLPTLPYLSFGTRSTVLVTGGIYSVAEPDLLGGFLVYSTISFVGLLLFYLAFRTSLGGVGTKRYFLLLFLLPSLIFWPSAIGKDALMTLFLGAGALGVAFLVVGRRRIGLTVGVLGTLAAFAIRPHVAVILLAAMFVAVAISFLAASQTRRALGQGVVAIAIVGAALWLLTTSAAETLGADAGVTEFAESVVTRTTRGGSAIDANPVTSLRDAPIGIVTTLLRPFPHEAVSLPQLLAAIEGLILLVLLLRSTPHLVKGWRSVIRKPYIAFALVFVVEFLVAFSVVSNLGLLVRQRAQMLPFLLVVIVAFMPPPKGGSPPDGPPRTERVAAAGNVGGGSVE